MLNSGLSTESRNAAGLVPSLLAVRYFRGKFRDFEPRVSDLCVLIAGPDISLYRKDAMQRHLKTKRHEGAVVPAEFLT
jgi:hypothetical protein